MLRAVKQKFDNYYINLEEFVTRNETNEDVKINKKMLIFYTHCLAVYFALSYFFNPLMTLSKFLGLQLYVVGQFLALLTRNYTIMAGSYILSALVSLYGCSVNPYDGLKSIAIALIQHNYSFLLNKNKILKLLFVIVSMALVNKSQTYVQEVLDQNNFEVIQHLILNLQYSWPTLYIINTISILYLTNKYWQSFQEKQEAQKALESKNKELLEVNQKLQDTLKLLEQTNKDLKDAMSARELFIASVSHELRNPLNSMLGNIELLSLDVKEPKCQSMLDSCKICGEVLLGLINNVLDVAKINAEKLELHIESENLHKVIEKAWIMSTTKMRQKGIKGQLLIGNNVPKHIEIDAYRLNQILLNLIGNATKFTQKGFVRVIVTWVKDGTLEQLNETNSELIPSETRSSSRIDLKADILRQVRLAKNQDLKTEESNAKSTDKQTHGHALNRVFSTKTFSHLQSSMNYTDFDETDTKVQQKLIQFSPLSLCHKGILKIEVKDSGCGIVATDLQRLFHPFSQADSSITAKFGGTGLGLYITKQLVQKMDGQIHVESQKNVGSHFWIGIPINTGYENKNEISFKKETNKSFPLISNLNNMKALIVDDDPFNQLILVNYLNKLNIQSEVANNGQEALEKFKRRGSNNYSFIITDIEMPIMDGLSACKAIRKYEQQMKIASCPIAIVTANSSDSERTQCLNPEGEIRVHSFFRKPFTFEECQAFIKNITHY